MAAGTDIDVAEEVSAIDGDVIAFTGDVEQFNDITSFITEYVGLGSFRLGARCTRRDVCSRSR